MKKAKQVPARHCLVFAVVIGWALTLAAAEPPGNDELHPEDIFSEHLDLLHVTIDLTVTDRKGRPVTDLGSRDFELFRNGVKQEILSFTAPLDPLDVEGHFDGFAEPRRHIVVYVDDLRLVPSRRKFLLRRTRNFLVDRMRRGDRVSLVAFDGTLVFLLSASSDEERVEAALAAAVSRPGLARLEQEGRRLQQALAEGISMAALGPQIESYTKRLQVDVLRSLAGLGAAVRTLAELGDPTIVLYLSDGYPERAGEIFGDQDSAAGGRGGGGVVTRRRSNGADDPTSQGIPIPSVQVVVSRPNPGPHSGPRPGVDSTALLLGPLITASQRSGVEIYPVRSSPLLGAARTASSRGFDQRSPLHALAEATGGDMLPYGQFDVALSKLSQRLGAAYTLGFQVASQRVPRPAPTTERIEVLIARKGLKAHYPKAYVEAPQSPVASEQPASVSSRLAGR